MLSNFGKRALTAILVTSVTVGVLAGLIVFFGFKIGENAKLIYDTRAEGDSVSRDINQFSSLKVSAVEAEPLFERLKKFLPDDDAITLFGDKVEALATGFGLGNDFNFVGDPVVYKGDIKYIKFSISVQGPYNNLIRFVDSLESFSYILNVSSISISEQGQSYGGIIYGSVFFRSIK